jgi:hypothetical protein
LPAFISPSSPGWGLEGPASSAASPNRFEWLHVSFNPRELFVFGRFQIVVGLKIQPELRRSIEVTCQSRAVSAEIPRRSAAMSAMRFTGTRKSSASLFMPSLCGFRKSSLRISPECIGLRFLFMLKMISLF